MITWGGDADFLPEEERPVPVLEQMRRDLEADRAAIRGWQYWGIWVAGFAAGAFVTATAIALLR